MYERVAKKLDGIADVYETECSRDRNVLDCYSYDVAGFPTIHVYNPRGTHEKDYVAFNDSRTFYDVMTWITSNIRPPFVHVKTGEDMIDQLDGADDFIAIFLPGTKTPSGLYKVANSFTVPCFVETEFTDIDADNFQDKYYGEGLVADQVNTVRCKGNKCAFFQSRSPAEIIQWLNDLDQETVENDSPKDEL